MTDQSKSPLARLRALWQGRLPLVDAFWTYAVFWGVMVNIAASLAALALLVLGKGTVAGADDGAALPLAAAALHLSPLPYNLIVLVGVWRSGVGKPWLARAVTRAATLAMFALFAVL